MAVRRDTCLWHEQCESCSIRCGHYTPEDDFNMGESFYMSILRENAMTYNNIIKDFSHGGDIL